MKVCWQEQEMSRSSNLDQALQLQRIVLDDRHWANVPHEFTLRDHTDWYSPCHALMRRRFFIKRTCHESSTTSTSKERSPTTWATDWTRLCSRG